MARQLEIAITAGTTTIKVSPPFNRGDFPERGVIAIESERISYENTTENEFLSCTRGYLGSTPATHAKGVTVSFVTELASTKEINTSVELTSPTDLSADIVNNTDIIVIVTAAPDVLVLTLPSPTTSPVGRILSVVHKTGSLGTLTVDSTVLAAGESKEFVWDGSGWSQAPVPTGGVANPLTEDLDAGGFVILNLGGLTLNTEESLILGNSGNAFIKFRAADNGLYLQSNASNQLDLVTASQLSIYANTDVDGNGTYQPFIEMKAAGNIDIGSGNNADINLIPNGTGRVDVTTSETTGASTATLLNSPVVGNPTTWFRIKINGTEYHIPAWAV